MAGIQTRLRHLVTVAKAGSFSRAAEELRITQPALSRSVASLEQTYGLQIFERSRTGVTVTPAGRQVLSEAENLLRNIRTFERNSRLYGSGDAGEIAIGFGPLIASILMPAIARTMLAERPEVAMNTSIRSPAAMLAQLLNDEIEVLFYAGSAFDLPSGVEAMKIGRMQVGFMARSSHPLAGTCKVTSTDLAKFPLASGTAMLPQRSFPMRTALQCDNYHILREITLDNDVVWLSSPLMCVADIEAGRLVELVPSDIASMWSDVTVFTRTGRVLSPLARQVTRIATEFFA